MALSQLRFVVLGIAAALISSGADSLALACDGNPFPPQFTDPGIFDRAMQAAAQLSIAQLPTAGLTVPHHLAAANLIARAFQFVKPEHFDKIVIIFPDHFRRTHLPFATTDRSFETIFGEVCTDQAATVSLLSHGDYIENSNLFGRDHGIGAILPFVRRYFPGVPIVPIAVSFSSRRSDWDSLLTLLQSLVTLNTLVVQSTDFSHYLSRAEASVRDQFTLNALSAFSLDQVASLSQPSNIDSRGAEYIQMRLQARLESKPIVLFNSNSQYYSKEYEPETTSYVVQLYPREPVSYVLPPLPGSHVVCFAGDLFTGRFLTSALRNKVIADTLEKSIKSVLRDCPAIVNLEGVFERLGGIQRGFNLQDRASLFSERSSLADPQSSVSEVTRGDCHCASLSCYDVLS